MLREAWKTADEFGDTGLYRIRTMLIYCIGYLSARTKVCFHWLKGDLDIWFENLYTEINKRG